MGVVERNKGIYSIGIIFSFIPYDEPVSFIPGRSKLKG